MYFWMSLLDQMYWIAGSVMGAALGNVITFNTKGLDFALTALFVMIFTEQCFLFQIRVPPGSG